MDPLSIAASVIDVCQAGDRLIQLVSKIRLYSNALVEIDNIIVEISDLCEVLDSIFLAVSQTAPTLITGVSRTLDSCNNIVLELEKTFKGLSNGLSKSDSKVQTQIYRVRWLKRRGPVESLRQRLRDAKSTLTLHLVSVNRYACFITRFESIYQFLFCVGDWNRLYNSI
jgi:hypothetical protein